MCETLLYTVYSDDNPDYYCLSSRDLCIAILLCPILYHDIMSNGKCSDETKYS